MNFEEIIRELVREELGRALGDRKGTPQALFTVQQAADRLMLAPATVYKMAERREIPSVKIGSRLLFRPEDLDRFIEERLRTRAPRPVLVPRRGSGARYKY